MSWFFYALTSALLFGTYYVMLKRNLKREHIYIYLAIYSIFTFLVLLPFYKKVSLPTSNILWILIIIDSSLLALFFLFTTMAYKNLEESEASPLSNLGLIFVVIMGVTFLGDTLGLKEWAGIFLMVLGTLILEVGTRIDNIVRMIFKSREHRKYIKYAFLAILFVSIVNILEKIILDPSSINLAIKAVDPFSLNFFTRFFLMTAFFSTAIFKKKFKMVTKHAIRNKGLLIILAAIIYNLANISYFRAVAVQQISYVLPVASLSSLFVVIVGGQLFHEHKLVQKSIATVIMVLATYLIAS